jgi:hypothetical protein
MQSGQAEAGGRTGVLVALGHTALFVALGGADLGRALAGSVAVALVVLGACLAIIAVLAGKVFDVAGSCDDGMRSAEVSSWLQDLSVRWRPAPLQGKVHGCRFLTH